MQYAINLRQWVQINEVEAGKIELGLWHMKERKLSETMMDSKVELFNISVLNCNWKSHKYRWQDVEFWFGISTKNLSKGKEKITKSMNMQ